MHQIEVVRILTTILITIASITFVQAGNDLKEVSGIVTDVNNQALVGAKVSLGPGLVVFTDMEGKFSLRNLPAGEYDIEISYLSFQNLEVKQFQLNARNSKSLLFRLNDR